MNLYLTDEQIENRAKEIIRYQNFQSKIALQKMNCTMPKSIFNNGVSYIKRGVANKKIMSKRMLEELDKWVSNHVQPLTPTPSERRKTKAKHYQKKQVHTPIEKLVPKTIITKFEYGVKIGDCIKMLNSEEEARAFIKGMRFIQPHAEAVLVEMEINVKGA